ncbi:unnamed protein product [Kuraishia capsulata CBS 1993]|uniref:Protein transport protein SFT2 n=1 Tax=Kuraishia capsulata CBS 1993 TaxID=1382522 RepID=W6MGM1_9ASCO|nr:uncharacterized protein KUCA_T00000654001 [Kuraishia capsulata CBS 1993]CDK24688.1 unnamed protein product [Kuraishia capsulata CBS 1993]
MALRFLNSIPGVNIGDDNSLSLPTSVPQVPTPANEAEASFSHRVASTFQQLNPFSDSNGAISLTSDEVVTSEPGLLHLSKFERLSVFAITLAGSALCFMLCFFLTPVFMVRPAKWVLLWTLGSTLFLVSFGVLQGFRKYAAHLFSVQRLPFTVTYFGSIVLTLVFCLVLRSVFLAFIACLVQMVAAIWYTVSYFPMGTRGLQVTTAVARSQVEGWLTG